METATQALHRLVYEPGRGGPAAAADPACCRTSGSTTSRASRGSSSGTRGRCRASSCRATSRPRATQPSPSSPAPPPPHRARSAAPLPAPAPLGRRGAHGGPPRRAAVPLPRSRLGGRPVLLELYVAVPEALRSPPACTGTTGTDTPSCPGRPAAAQRLALVVTGVRGEPAGAIASAATGTSTGTRAPCSPSCSRPPTRRASSPRSTPASRTERRRHRRFPTACTNGPWRSSPSAPERRPSTRAVRQPRARPWTARPSSSRSSRPRSSAPRGATRSSRPGTATPPPTCRRRAPIRRDRHPRAELAAPDGSLARPPAGRAPPASARRCGVGVPHHVVVHDVEDTQPGVYRWPDLSAPAAGFAAGQALSGVLRPGARPRRGVVVISAIDVGTLDKPRVPRGTAGRRTRGGGSTCWRTASARERVRDDVPRQRGATRPGRAWTLCSSTCVGVPEYASARVVFPASRPRSRWCDPGSAEDPGRRRRSSHGVRRRLADHSRAPRRRAGPTEQKMFGELAFLVGGNMAIRGERPGRDPRSRRPGRDGHPRLDDERHGHGDARPAACPGGSASRHRGRSRRGRAHEWVGVGAGYARSLPAKR